MDLSTLGLVLLALIVSLFLVRFISRALRPPRIDPRDPYAGVREPIHKGPSSRSAAVALPEPDARLAQEQDSEAAAVLRVGT